MSENKHTDILSGQLVELADMQTYKTATFIISVLDEPDLMGRIIEKADGEAAHQSIVGFPIVAKLICDADGNPVDFGGHEMTTIQKEDGTVSVRFATQPVGSVTSSWIEKREVPGYVGKKDCIMISAKIWSTRYPEYSAVLDKLWAAGKVQSSWELVAASVLQTVRGRVLKAISFIGNALLGTQHLGAVPGAGVYEYAEADEAEMQLASALSRDMQIIEEGGETLMNEEKKALQEEAEVEVENTETEVIEEETAETSTETEQVAEEENAEDTSEVSEHTESAAWTDRDLRQYINRAYEQAGHDGWLAYLFPLDNQAWFEPYRRESDMDYDLVSYSIANESVEIVSVQPVKLAVNISSVNSEIASRDDAIVKANDRIRDLEAQVNELASYKERCEQEDAEKAKIEHETKCAELKAYAVKSGFITEDELVTEDGVCKMIAELDEAGIKSLIAERFMQSLENKNTETAEISAPVVKVVMDDAEVAEEAVTNQNFMAQYLRRTF